MSHGGARRGGVPGPFHLSSPCMPNACQPREFGTEHRKQAYQQHGNKQFLLQNVYLQAELANPYSAYFSWPVHTPRSRPVHSTCFSCQVHIPRVSVVQFTHALRFSYLVHAPPLFSVVQSTHPAFQLSSPDNTPRSTHHPSFQLSSPHTTHRFSCPAHTLRVSVVQSTDHPSFQLSSPQTPLFSCPVQTTLRDPHTTHHFSCPVHTPRLRFSCPVHSVLTVSVMQQMWGVPCCSLQQCHP
jgi:hypothetical protein